MTPPPMERAAPSGARASSELFDASFSSHPLPETAPLGISFLGEVGLLISTVALAAPFLTHRIEGWDLARWLDSLAALSEDRTFRQGTGYAGLVLVVIQFGLAARKRTRLRLPMKPDAWRALHRFVGPPLLGIVLAHTGGAAGVHSNQWLLGTLVTMMLVAQGGHVVKAYVAERANVGIGGQRMTHIARSVNGERGFIHNAGLHLHVLFAVSTAILLVFHVLAVYYF